MTGNRATLEARRAADDRSKRNELSEQQLDSLRENARFLGKTSGRRRSELLGYLGQIAKVSMRVFGPNTVLA